MDEPHELSLGVDKCQSMCLCNASSAHMQAARHRRVMAMMMARAAPPFSCGSDALTLVAANKSNAPFNVMSAAHVCNPAKLGTPCEPS